MGGCSLNVTYKSGNLEAYFNAYADFLINYRPFSFVARVGVTVGVKYTLNLWVTTKHFDVHLGCSLDLHGPPIAGIVHVDWSILSFDIHFGSASPRNQPLTWVEFCALLRQDSGDAKDDPENTMTGKHLHTFANTGGVIDGPSKYGGGPLLVDASRFAFRFTTLFPLPTIAYDVGDLSGDGLTTTDPIYGKSMHITQSQPVTSSLTVTIIDSHGTAANFSYEILQKASTSSALGSM